MLTEEQRAMLQAKLEAMVMDLKGRLAALREESRPVGLDQPVGRLTRMDMIQQQQMASGQQQRIEVELRQVAAALDRLTRSIYGLCLRCQEPIPYERLTIRPVSTLCFACQQALEGSR